MSLDLYRVGSPVCPSNTIFSAFVILCSRFYVSHKIQYYSRTISPLLLGMIKSQTPRITKLNPKKFQRIRWRHTDRLLTTGSSNNGRMPFDSFSIVHNRTDPLPAPDAARSLFLQTVSALTQESADDE